MHAVVVDIARDADDLTPRSMTPTRMRLPSAADGCPHISRAMFSETTATRRSSKMSVQARSRPATMGVPTVRK